MTNDVRIASEASPTNAPVLPTPAVLREAKDLLQTRTRLQNR